MTEEQTIPDKEPVRSEYIEGREEPFKPSCMVCGSTDIQPFLLGKIPIKHCGNKNCHTMLCPKCLLPLEEFLKDEWRCPNRHPLS